MSLTYTELLPAGSLLYVLARARRNVFLACKTKTLVLVQRFKKSFSWNFRTLDDSNNQIMKTLAQGYQSKAKRGTPVYLHNAVKTIQYSIWCISSWTLKIDCAGQQTRLIAILVFPFCALHRNYEHTNKRSFPAKVDVAC